MPMFLLGSSHLKVGVRNLSGESALALVVSKFCYLYARVVGER